MKKTMIIVAVLAGTVMTAAAAQERGERPDFATLDTDGSGGVSLAELQAHRASRFSDRDTNGDGGLSAEELASADAEKMAKRAARMLERLDTNEDGLVQQSEMEARGGDRMEQMFTRADADEDGEVTEAEFEAAKKHRGGRHGRGHGGKGRG